MDNHDTNRAEELKAYLTERREEMAYGILISGFDVSESGDGNSLTVSVIPAEGYVSFKPLRINLHKTVTPQQWERKKKDICGNIKGLRPMPTLLFEEEAVKAANEALAGWRKSHPFTGEMIEFLLSADAPASFPGGKNDTVRFLAGKGRLECAGSEVNEKYIKASFKKVPFKAVREHASGVLKVNLTGADALYRNLCMFLDEYDRRSEIERYISDQFMINPSVVCAKRPGEFRITFPSDFGPEAETVLVGESYKEDVREACRRAMARIEAKKEEAAEKLKNCPSYGTFIAQAVINTLSDNNNSLTGRQVVNLLRGTGLSDGYVFGASTGKYRLYTKEDIQMVIRNLERFGVLRRRTVRGQYQDYKVYSVTAIGNFFTELQNTPVPGRAPETEQEYMLAIKSALDSAESLPKEKTETYIRALAKKPGIFLTEPAYILDFVERIGKPAEELLRLCLENEDSRKRQRIQNMLLKAAAGKGKIIPKNGLDAYRQREAEKRQSIDETERKDRELFRQVLTEIPKNYVDLYPQARSMTRHFVLHIGPTNSGKTHDAIEDLMRAQSGIYLAPLRLLAYEQFENMNRAGCPCSLITGEERYIIDGAWHQSSTVEMLRPESRYDVAVIDEAQMIADPDRGGAWTAAVMGVCADKVHVCASPEAEKRLTEIIKDCGDDYEIIRHNRMTPLIYEEKLFRFPQNVQKGDALIVFSRRSVHAVAAQLRSRGVGCSVIYGALPYDVRHRQAELFASGTTDVVVATDAIGMGMNLPIRRVVFMETEKFDGSVRRPLHNDEISQVAGRAGRYGIYDTGYVTSAKDNERIKAALANPSRRLITKAVIDFPETLLTVDASLDELLRKWNEVVPAKGWRKESIDTMIHLSEMTRDLGAPKQLSYDFLTIPFDDKDEELCGLWKSAFAMEVRGEKYSIYDLAAAVEINDPTSADSINMLEQQHHILDLYYNLARKFQPEARTLDMIMQKKRICSENIMKVLDSCGFIEKRCGNCRRILPWNYPYGLCKKCHEEKLMRSWRADEALGWN